MLIRFLMQVLVLMFVGQTALAEIVLAPSLSYYAKTEQENGTDTERKLTEMSVKLGYIFDFNLYIGALYNLSDEEFATSSSDYNIGLSAGYVRWNFYLLAHYILDAQKDLGTGGVKYGEGTGYQIDLGYILPVTENFSLGPQISKREIKYGRRDVQNLSVGTDRLDAYWLPYMTLWFHF